MADTLREELEEAFEEDDQATEEATEEVAETETEEVAESAEEHAETEESSDEEESDSVDEKEPEPETAAKEAPKNEIKPPINYNAKDREEWKNVPQKIKERIRERELGIARAMENTATAKRTHASLGKLADSYASVMAAEGVSDPLQAVQGLFQTVAELRMGSPQQQAAKMAQLIGHYGIDISMLDSALAGGDQQQQPQQQTQDDYIARAVQQAVAPLYQEREQQQQHQQQQVTNAVGAELQEFAANAEFINDVRGTMADLIEVAARQNRKMSFKEAYDTACAMDPNISSVVSQRNEQAKLQSVGQKSAAKRNAGSSLGARHGGSLNSSGPASLRSEIESAWENFS